MNEAGTGTDRITLAVVASKVDEIKKVISEHVASDLQVARDHLIEHRSGAAAARLAENEIKESLTIIKTQLSVGDSPVRTAERLTTLEQQQQSLAFFLRAQAASIGIVVVAVVALIAAVVQTLKPGG